MKPLLVSGFLLVLICCQCCLSQTVGDTSGPAAIGGPQMPPVDPMKVQPGYFVPLKQDYVGQTVTGFNNTATCNFDKKCFKYSEGCTFVNCRPYNRSSPISCEDCMNLCLSQQATPGPYCCKSMVYDVQYRICDLFSQDIGGNLANLAHRPGHIYFQPTGQCQATVNTPPPTQAPVAICPSGQVEKMVAIKDYQLAGVTGQTVPAADDTACAHACISNQANGSSFACKSAQFANGQCTLSTAQPVAEGSVQKAPGSTYFQKLCFPSGSVAGCAEIFEEDPQKILIGQSRQVADASSIGNCWQSCLEAQAKFGFACASAMYFANITSQNCILNSETKLTKPDVFTQADDDKTFYLETGCGGAGGGGGVVANGTSRLRDQSLQSQVSSLWGRTTSNDAGAAGAASAAAPIKTGDSLWGRVKREIGKSDYAGRQAWN